MSDTKNTKAIPAITVNEERSAMSRQISAITTVYYQESHKNASAIKKLRNDCEKEVKALEAKDNAEIHAVIEGLVSLLGETEKEIETLRKKVAADKSAEYEKKIKDLEARNLTIQNGLDRYVKAFNEANTNTMTANGYIKDYRAQLEKSQKETKVVQAKLESAEAQLTHRDQVIRKHAAELKSQREDMERKHAAEMEAERNRARDNLIKAEEEENRREAERLARKAQKKAEKKRKAQEVEDAISRATNAPKRRRLRSGSK